MNHVGNPFCFQKGEFHQKVRSLNACILGNKRGCSRDGQILDKCADIDNISKAIIKSMW